MNKPWMQSTGLPTDYPPQNYSYNAYPTVPYTTPPYSYNPFANQQLNNPLTSFNSAVATLSNFAQTISSTLYTTQATYHTLSSTLNHVKQFKYKRYIALATFLWIVYSFWGQRTKARAKYTFDSRGGKEVSIKEGQELWVVGTLGDWLQVEIESNQGLVKGIVPKDYVLQ